MTLRIYADFNSGGSPGHGPCWLLRYGPQRVPLDDVAAELGLRAGMVVTLYYEENHEGQSEGFEVDTLTAIRWRSSDRVAGRRWPKTRTSRFD